MATLILICGLPGSGKTTKAKQLELEQSALRLTPDEWIRPPLWCPSSVGAKLYAENGGRDTFGDELP